MTRTVAEKLLGYDAIAAHVAVLDTENRELRIRLTQIAEAAEALLWAYDHGGPDTGCGISPHVEVVRALSTGRAEVAEHVDTAQLLAEHRRAHLIRALRITGALPLGDIDPVLRAQVERAADYLGLTSH